MSLWLQPWESIQVDFFALKNILFKTCIVLRKMWYVCKHMNIKEFIYFFGCFYKYTNRSSHHWLPYIGPSNYIVCTRRSRWRQCPPDPQLWRLPHNDGMVLPNVKIFPQYQLLFLEDALEPWVGFFCLQIYLGFFLQDLAIINIFTS